MIETTVWLQISAGKCPAECEWVVARLAPIMTVELIKENLSVEELDRTIGDHATDAKSILIRVTGENTTTIMQSWLGTIQWTGTSPYRPHHKRKNWFVSILSFDEPKATVWDTSQITFEAMRASGPGGQHVNRTESAVRATHVPTGISSMAQEERSQHMNRRLALARLARLLEERQNRETKQAENARWQQHNNLVRGNPTRIYRGDKWIREL